jgi:hypothetical protein
VSQAPVVLEGTVITARHLRARRRGRRAAWFLIGLRLLFRRRFHERLIVVFIVLVALGRLAREKQVRTIKRLLAWDRRQARRYQRTGGAKAAQSE